MELQAVILAAGRGSRMTDLTASLPKALLPVANKPMIWYPISMLEKAGFDEVIILTLDSTKGAIYRALKSTQIQIKMDFVTVSSEEDLGTADSLRILNEQRKIKTDILVVSCDLITDIALHKLVDVHRTYDSTMTALMMALPEQSSESLTIPGTKSKKKLESRDLVGLDEKGQRLVFMAAEEDIEEFLTVRKSILEKHPFIKVGTSLLDAHMYIFKKWVIDYLSEHKNISSVKGELIPCLVKKQFIKKRAEDVDDEGSMEHATHNHNYSSVDALKQKTLEMSSWTGDEGGITNGCIANIDAIKCHVYVMDSGFCSRANSLAAYCDVNRQILQSKHVLEEENFVHSTAKVKPKTQVGQDSMVGEESSVGEKVSVKRSVIGQHCNIGDKVKIANSIIMDHVTIKEGCVIHGSVICGNASLSEQVELKDCLVGSKQTLPEKAKFSNEIIIDNNYMMEI
ncbi:translation initiation factor eIF-2B subunit gamma-like [Anneissia japonica]|uniref:translation initiation factor eIF-2B subunit gamma-like n=1 Tax=Anneissia japonica TaxID=1529436 RepID=UPI0014259A79|nr:translation initiation factor eIF-2B subunit gamma-like [Anneissia japonica]XP_033115125.1 translation initiation factor eIF-2B subunit gamma-like [Anneissia japonica]XP_033115126.1 translation initiation factor eIF-2B subunit gamma-like [Anneissia japonica]